ncbi:MAG: HU family DNA-binding protein [Flavobacteriales bacterium]
MNKTELIDAIAEKAGISKVTAKNAMEAFTSIIIQYVSEGDRVTIVDFGTFFSTERGERFGINPQTRQKLKIAARTVVKFKPGSKFSETVDMTKKKK